MATWILSLVCILCWGGWAVTQKMSVRHLPPLTAQFASDVWFMLLLPVVYMVMQPLGISLTWSTPGFLWAGAGAMLSTVACISFLYAVQTSQVHLVTGITASYPVVTLMLSALLLGEKITLTRCAGICVIVLGAILLEM